MKRFEIVCYNEDYAKEKLALIQAKKKECFIVHGLCFGNNYDVIDCYIVVYYANKKLKV